MKNDSYLSGALVLAFSVKRFDNTDFVCLVTDEISETVKNALRLVFDKVIEIQAVKLKHRIKDGRTDRDELLTRFTSLLLDYDKIILFDADVLVLAPVNDLFVIDAPAGIINERKENFITNDRNIESGQWKWHGIYGGICPHGAKIPSYITDRPKSDITNFGVNSALWRLDPSEETYNSIFNALRSEDTAALFQKFKLPEMQLATVLWSGQWTSIDVKYCSIGGYPRLDLLKSTHFAGIKPWSIRNKSLKQYAKYPDFKEWYSVFLQLFYSYPALREVPALRKIEEFILCNRLL